MKDLVNSNLIKPYQIDNALMVKFREFPFMGRPVEKEVSYTVGVDSFFKKVSWLNSHVGLAVSCHYLEVVTMDNKVLLSYGEV